MKYRSIAVVGGGFCGFMTAYHLIKSNSHPLYITLINAGYKDGRGIAYGTSSEKFLLNVPVAKMSAIPSKPDHFLNWLHLRHPFNLIDKDILGKMFVPRKEFGTYLSDLFEEMQQHTGMHQLECIADFAEDISAADEMYAVQLKSGRRISADCIVLATGNEIPGNPSIEDHSFYSSAKYFNNPWNEDSFRTIDQEKDVLIIGNGLTMVDTVLGLHEYNCKGTIYSISPHGFNILPHRHQGLIYTRLLEELQEPVTLSSLFRLFNRHVRILRHFGLSAEPVVDSIRPLAQEIWKKLDTKDKKRFLTHVRHLWGVARHRLPLHIYDFIQNLRIQNKLIVKKGTLKSITENQDRITVTFSKGRNADQQIVVGRVINCTGPSLDITRSRSILIKNLVRSGMIRPDELNLGIDADSNGNVIAKDGKANQAIFTLGGNLRGLLWESTAVPELRVQAENLSGMLLQRTAPVMNAEAGER
jgi:uncharacterized NAD(P)/FAD-binding protein YdhS